MKACLTFSLSHQHPATGRDLYRVHGPLAGEHEGAVLITVRQLLPQLLAVDEDEDNDGHELHREPETSEVGLVRIGLIILGSSFQ